MTEREAFEAWWIAEMNNPAHPNLTTFDVWQAACVRVERRVRAHF